MKDYEFKIDIDEAIKEEPEKLLIAVNGDEFLVKEDTVVLLKGMKLIADQLNNVANELDRLNTHAESCGLS